MTRRLLGLTRVTAPLSSSWVLTVKPGSFDRSLKPAMHTHHEDNQLLSDVSEFIFSCAVLHNM